MLHNGILLFRFDICFFLCDMSFLCVSNLRCFNIPIYISLCDNHQTDGKSSSTQSDITRTKVEVELFIQLTREKNFEYLMFPICRLGQNKYMSFRVNRYYKYSFYFLGDPAGNIKNKGSNEENACLNNLITRFRNFIIIEICILYKI